MDVQFILENLYRKFDSHKYALNNTYVYDDESDFFSIDRDKYSQEVEIKTSYPDFRADFTKTNKHAILSQKYKGNEIRLEKLDRVYEITYPGYERIPLL